MKGGRQNRGREVYIGSEMNGRKEGGGEEENKIGMMGKK